MADADPSVNEMQAVEDAVPAGVRLKSTREDQKLSVSDIAARTRISERYLIALEQGKYDVLASNTYAVGFARSYARVVGLDDEEIVAAVRAEISQLNETSEARRVVTFEQVDPSRVPEFRTAWLGGLAAVALVGVGLLFWGTMYSPSAPLPTLKSGPVASSSVVAVPSAVASANTPNPSGTVTLTAIGPQVWVKVEDSSGSQLLQKELAQGEVYTVPADAIGVVLSTARPDLLQIAIGGSVVPSLGDKPQVLRKIPVTATALMARPQPSVPAGPGNPEARAVVNDVGVAPAPAVVAAVSAVGHIPAASAAARVANNIHAPVPAGAVLR